MRAHTPTLVVFSLISLFIVAWSPVTGTRAAAPRETEAEGAAASDAVVAGKPEIVDGDSIKIAGIAIRLHGIDAPEMAQACTAASPAGGLASPASETWRCGLEARRALAALVGNGPVACTPTTRDKYGRTVARCHVGGNQGRIDLGAEMVRQGMAWAFVRYSSDYVALEQEARAARRGIWQAETQAAWDFRAAKWQHAESESAGPEGCTIKGNVTWKGERIYHLPWSPWYGNVRMDSGTAQRQGKRWFCNEAEAVAAGWRPALR